MLKKIGLMVTSFCLALACVGEMSETQRITIDGIEWLCTVDDENKRIVLEKAILLTADSYLMTIPLTEFSWVLPDSVENYEFYIGASAFEGNELLRAVYVVGDMYPLQLTICERAFKNCSKLVSFGITDYVNIVNIQDSAFEGCGALVDWDDVDKVNSVGFGEGWKFNGLEAVTNIGERAFYNMKFPALGYTSLDLKECENIGSEAFVNCSSIFNSIKLSSKVKHIAESAFNQLDPESPRISDSCHQPAIIFSEGIESIGANAFEGVSKWSLDNIWSNTADPLVLPNGVINIEASAFRCAQYKSLTLPASLKYIGNFAFAGSNYKEDIWVEFNSKLTDGLVIPDSVEKIDSCAFANHPYLKEATIGKGVRELPSGMFMCCTNLSKIVIPHTVITVSDDAFVDCINLRVVIPESVSQIIKMGEWIKSKFGYPKSVTFEGLPPIGIMNCAFMKSKDILVPVEYRSQWAPYMRPNMKFAKKVNGEWVALGGKVISNVMRPSDPTIMDIKYTVTSTKDKVDVRFLAFQDGNRSFAKVLRPETFVEGTEANVGDGVAANVEHTISWQVSKDWDVDLAKVSIEVYVQEDNLLPLQLTTIPAIGERAAVTFSRNVPEKDKVMNALYWLYADKAADLTLANGVLKCGNTQLVNGSTLSDANAVSYIYSKMGYGTLSGDMLKYVNELMRTNINPSGLTQYAVKEGAAQ